MKTSPQDWLLWEESETLPFTGGVSFHTRTASKLVVTDQHGLIVGYGVGEQEIRITGNGMLTFECDTPIWLRPSTRVQERLQASTQVFTTLDRPAPMSPEMQAIARMMRRNEIARERERSEMEARFAQFRSHADGKPSNDPQQTSAEKKEAPREEIERSAASAEKPDKPPPKPKGKVSGTDAAKTEGDNPTPENSG